MSLQLSHDVKPKKVGTVSGGRSYNNQAVCCKPACEVREQATEHLLKHKTDL